MRLPDWRDVLCCSVGCNSLFARWFQFQWPHRLICARLPWDGRK